MRYQIQKRSKEQFLSYPIVTQINETQPQPPSQQPSSQPPTRYISMNLQLVNSKKCLFCGNGH